MRRFLFCLVIVCVAATAATGVHASTECERWFIAYKTSLAQSNAAKKLKAANHRAHRYLHRRLATFHKPHPTNKPRVIHAYYPRPRMSREETLHRFNLACGDLPEESVATQTVQEEELAPDFLSGRPLHPGVPVEDGSTPTELIALNELPTYSQGETGWPGPPSIGTPPGFGGFGGGGILPNTPTPNTPSTPVGTVPPEVPVTPVVPAVPEPSSVLLVLTGIAGAAGVVRNRVRGRA